MFKIKSISKFSDVASDDIGDGTRVGAFSVIKSKVKIGDSCDISSHCLIEDGVFVGNKVSIKSGVRVCSNSNIGNDVYVGENSVILNDVVIGSNSFIKAGVVVSKSIPPNAIVDGNPARIISYVNAIDCGDLSFSIDDVKSKKFSSTSTRVRGVVLHNMQHVVDIRGNLTVGEFEKSIPFAAKRYFLVFDVPSMENRGEHAHRECHQFLICVRGSCAVVADDGNNRQEFFLNRPDLGIYMPPMTWGIQYKYSSDAVLLVFASHYYDGDDYIRDYNKFVDEIGCLK